MQKGFSTLVGIIIIVVVAIVAFGGIFTYQYFQPSSEPQQNLVGGDKDKHGCIGSAGYSWCEVKNKCLRVWEEPCQNDQTTETPTIESNVTNQPAYLINAYSKNGKNYIDVDYVEWLHAEASIAAQIEDGKCANTNSCEFYPSGYKRNRNPKIRTLELSPSVTIKVSGTISAWHSNTMGQNLSISFGDLKEAVLTLKPYLPSNPTFKDPLTFVTVSIKNNIVTNITEPYQE